MSFSIFKAAKGSGINDSDASVIGPVFEEINRECGGSYTVDDVVDRLDKGDPITEPLRPYYLSNPEDQRRAYMRTRTQELQRWLVIEVIDPDRPEEPVEIRGFTTAIDSPQRRDGPARYTSSSRMLASRSEKKRDEFIAEQINRIRQQLDKWDRQLKAWRELDGVRKSLRTLKRQLEETVAA